MIIGVAASRSRSRLQWPKRHHNTNTWQNKLAGSIVEKIKAKERMPFCEEEGAIYLWVG